MSSAWYINLITAALVVVWMGWTYEIIQTYGPSPALILSSLLIGIVSVLAIHGQYVSYLKLGNKIVIGRTPPNPRQTDEPKPNQPKHERERERERNR